MSYYRPPWQPPPAPRDRVKDPRPWDEDGLMELRNIALHNIVMAKALAPLLRTNRDATD